MKENEANDMRCIASEIIIKLMEAGQWEQLWLLQRHATSALERKPKEIELFAARQHGEGGKR